MEEEEEIHPKRSRRCSRPGKKRLYVVLSILLSFLLGSPFWRKLTEIYRTPLPLTAIEKEAARVSSNSVFLPCRFHVIFTGTDDIAHSDALVEQTLRNTASSISEQMREIIMLQNLSYGGCGAAFKVAVSLDVKNKCLRGESNSVDSVWRCGLMDSDALEVALQADDDLLDEFLWEYSEGSRESSAQKVQKEREKESSAQNEIALRKTAGGLYRILIWNKIGLKSRRTVVGKYRHAWITGFDTEFLTEEHDLSVLVSNVAVRTFMNGGIYELHDFGSTGESMPIGADGTAILSFSLLNSGPSDWVFDWNFDELEEQFLLPVVRALDPIALLTVESQVLYYTPKAVNSYWDDELDTYVVFTKELPFFVNANEWHLDTSTAVASRSKLLQFAIYIPAATECPLHLKLKDGELSETNGFISPGWGGVVIYNPSWCMRHNGGVGRPLQELSAKDLQKVMHVVIAQLRTLFGVPPVPEDGQEHGTHYVLASTTGFAEWELDVLLRRRTAADMASCTSTLRSLSRLVQSLPNMVIMDEIGDQVRSSLLAAEASHKNALLGVYHATAEAARGAKAWAEAAFFQPSIMSLLYFPLEHHFAIYTPFFVPVLLHTFLAAIKEITRYYRRCKEFSVRSSQV
eukprot:c25854_g1_i1 orf=213-2102(+)